MVRLKIRVTGRVQGVWFRDSTRREALRLGLAGFVRNEADGAVYLEAEGGEEAVDELVSWCHRGPVMARVEKVETGTAESTGGTGFEIVG